MSFKSKILSCYRTLQWKPVSVRLSETIRFSYREAHSSVLTVSVRLSETIRFWMILGAFEKDLKKWPYTLNIEKRISPAHTAFDGVMWQSLMRHYVASKIPFEKRRPLKENNEVIQGCCSPYRCGLFTSFNRITTPAKSKIYLKS